jgi:hypothetical protein
VSGDSLAMKAKTGHFLSRIVSGNFACIKTFSVFTTWQLDYNRGLFGGFPCPSARRQGLLCLATSLRSGSISTCRFSVDERQRLQNIGERVHELFRLLGVAMRGFPRSPSLLNISGKQIVRVFDLHGVPIHPPKSSVKKCHLNYAAMEMSRPLLSS